MQNALRGDQIWYILILQLPVQEIINPLAEEKNDQDLRFCVYSSLVNRAKDFLSPASLIMTEENLKSS